MGEIRWWWWEIRDLLSLEKGSFGVGSIGNDNIFYVEQQVTNKEEAMPICYRYIENYIP